MSLYQAPEVPPFLACRSPPRPIPMVPPSLPPTLPFSCVAIVASSALRAMIKPGLLAVAAPCAVGIAFRGLGVATGQPMLGAKAVAGFLMFTTVAGGLDQCLSYLPHASKTLVL